MVSSTISYPYGEIVDEIIDNGLEENIWNKFINIYKGHVDLKEVIIMEVGKKLFWFE